MIQIKLPKDLTSSHKQAVIAYLADSLKGEKEWQAAFQAFDLLDKAIVISADEEFTFRELYRQIVDHRLADSYLRELLAITDIERQSPMLWARYARQIVAEFTQRGWRRADPETQMLLSYLLYWWNAFARGYAFEVEIFNDLRQSNVQFEAHNILDRYERYSPSDLIVSTLLGDIKTSVYFAQLASSLAHDFYIVRLSLRGRIHTIVVLLQPSAWEEINGDTIDGNINTIADQPSFPVRVRQAGHELVGLNYDEWKRRIIVLQGEHL